MNGQELRKIEDKIFDKYDMYTACHLLDKDGVKCDQELDNVGEGVGL